VPTGVHLSGVQGRPFSPRRFLNREGIHIRTQPDSRPTFAPIDDRNNARNGDAFVNFINPEFAQPIHDIGRRFMTLLTQFGVLVQITAPLRHVVGERRDTVNDGHCESPVDAFSPRYQRRYRNTIFDKPL
jgi:hypothetical protein